MAVQFDNQVSNQNFQGMGKPKRNPLYLIGIIVLCIVVSAFLLLRLPDENAKSEAPKDYIPPNVVDGRT